MKRSDTHAPSTFDPAEYTEVGEFDLHHEDGFEYLDREFVGKPYFSGNMEHRGRCDHCGAGPLRYGVIFYHEPSDSLIAVGLTCAATKLNLTSRTALDIRQRGEQIRREKERNDFLASLTVEQTLAIAFAESVNRTPYTDESGANIFRPKFPAVRGETVAFLSDLTHKLHRYGSLSEKQIAAMVKIMNRNMEFLLNDAAEVERMKGAPILTEGRQTIEGTVISIKTGENDYGFWIKMLVKTDDGNKVYGTIPSAIDPEKGDRVRFDAKVEPKEEHFGFYSRPTKPQIIETTEAGA